MRVANLVHNGRLLSVRVWQCESFVERALGLIGQSPPRHGQMLRISRCRAMHTFGLRHPVDVVFTDSSGRVQCCIRALPPRRLAWNPRAHAVWEMRAGMAALLGLEPGGQLATPGDA